MHPAAVSIGFIVHNDFIQELQDAISNGSTGRRLSSLRQVTDLFLDQGSRLSHAQIEVFDSLMLSFISDCDVDALVETQPETGARVVCSGHSAVEAGERPQHHHRKPGADAVARAFKRRPH